MKPSWDDIRSRLPAAQPPRRAQDAAEFWSDFRARARLVNQEALQPAPRRLLPLWVRWTAGGLAAAAAALVLLTLPLQEARPLGNRIQSLEVFASHSGVFIMNDSSRQGTVIWISDMRTL